MISSPSAAPGGRGRTRIQIRQEKGERGKRGNHGGDGRLSGLPVSSLSCPSSGGADLPDWELLGLFVVM